MNTMDIAYRYMNEATLALTLNSDDAMQRISELITELENDYAVEGNVYKFLYDSLNSLMFVLTYK